MRLEAVSLTSHASRGCLLDIACSALLQQHMVLTKLHVRLLQTGVCIELDVNNGGFACDCLLGFKKEGGGNNTNGNGTQDESPCIGERH